tara:strand:+ start:788 stop:919 length:132 start_codon:yes stop_codon:yes gene_type:complete
MEKANYYFKTKAKDSNYNPEVIKLTWEEIESIPCVTDKEREVN